MLTLAGCSRAPERGAERVAILPFENLSGDSTLDWVASAAPAMVTAELSGNPKLTPIRAGSVNDGYLGSADRLVHGFFVKRGAALQIDVQVEDAARHKTMTRAEADGDLIQAVDAISKRLDSSAHAFSTSSAAAVSAWGQQKYEEAVGVDPDFGAAWLSWAESVAQRGQTAEAIRVTERALVRAGLRSEADRARIELLQAALRKDDLAREKALTALVKIEPSDTSLLAMAAETSMNLRDFPAAARYFKSILRVDPAASGVLNSLGYAEGYAGDLDAAKSAFEAYGKQDGQKTNSLDSLGEVHFIRGRFAEAEKYFVQAQQSDPAFAEGAELLKAAYARWLGGDLKGADALMGHYLENRKSAHDPLVAWREAVWDFVTGRRDLALAKLAEVQPQFADRQRAVWTARISGDLATLKEKYQRTAPSSDGEARVFYAAALFSDGQKDAARKLLELWPLPVETGGDSMVESLVFPKFIELRRSLGMSVP